MPNLYKYELVKNSHSGAGTVLYSITNLNGFSYDVSKDGKYIAILNYAESMGDETLTIIKSDGSNLKDFGHLDSPQTLAPIYWTDPYYWLFKGIPIGEPSGVVRVNADTNQVDNL